ncbi:Tetraspanin family integral membrane protein [Handroanthus impetiginosus]|uniref:Tetraspanin family integral membrane protein n=1 Tax=Handroanthus impetiginosus TaxID=429701 RepID=A0A2G9GGW5_9LAMI|nr:Tetraspanin family integral membrane protein [Handroanthus impetiginosus]
MARISNGMITGLNILTLLMAFSAIGFSLWFHVKPESPCQRVFKTPLLAVGAALLVVSLAGLVGSWCRVSFLLWLYLFVLFVLILALMVFTVFTIIVTNKGVGNAVSGKGVGDHRLGDYSNWLQKYVINAKNWDEIKSCLVDVKLCQRIESGKGEDYYKHHMPPILSGCCKPPNYCGFHFQNATFWTMPKTGPAVPNPDCKTWSNVQKELCFDCQSCKTAVLNNIKREWRLLALINIAIIVFVIIIYSVGCCALRNNRHGYQKQRRHP